MNGGDHPVHDGDYLVMESITGVKPDSLVGQTVGLERINKNGEAEYLLRSVGKSGDGILKLHATNPEYEDMEMSERIITFARLIEVIDPLRMRVRESFMKV